MKVSKKAIEQLQKDMENATTLEDIMGKNGVMNNLLKNILEDMLEAEMTNHLGYEKYSSAHKSTENRRNGTTSKRIRSKDGEMDISIPRDRNGEFEPILIKKYQRDLGPIEDKVISMYAKGMSTRDINAHLEDIYGINLSPAAISDMTNRILERIKEWQNRPLDPCYVIVYFDAIHFKVRDNGVVKNKAAYTALGINTQGYKELLGIWINEAEGANFWHGVISEIRNRGVEDILIAAVDGLKGLPEAIEAVFPKVEIQLCVIHQIRNSLKYIAYKNQKAFMKELKQVYQAPTKEAALHQLDKLEENWGKTYPLVIRSWRNNWERLSTYFKYPQEIRRIIYTTNIVEGLHRQFRKVTKSKSIFPNDESLRKILYLAYMDIQKKWTSRQPKWNFIISQLAIIFGERIKLDL